MLSLEMIGFIILILLTMPLYLKFKNIDNWELPVDFSLLVILFAIFLNALFWIRTKLLKLPRINRKYWVGFYLSFWSSIVLIYFGTFFTFIFVENGLKTFKLWFVLSSFFIFFAAFCHVKSLENISNEFMKK